RATRWSIPASSSFSARPIARSTSTDALIRRPCSSHVYHVTDTPASIATSSRRSPGVRLERPGGRPTCAGVTCSRRTRRNSASVPRESGPRRSVALMGTPEGLVGPVGVGDEVAILIVQHSREQPVGTVLPMAFDPATFGPASFDTEAMLDDLQTLVGVESPS